MDVVCTAGHVDHGKSTLVRALTGMEPDRFAEERRRGLTIDIGFGWTTIGTPGEQRTLAFVDLPGHERFIANMLAGAGPVDAALFVVAADEGWKPQSQEHLDILDLLDVSTAVVALTKADTIGADRLERTRADVSARIAATPLAGAEIVPVSAVTGAGLDTLRRALGTILEQRPAPPDVGRPRLWVDRSFSIKGAGTVVTGTLTGGALAVGDDVVVLPAGPAGRVRGLQSLKDSVARAGPGTRVAVNLSGVERQAVGRGDVVATAGQHPVTTDVDVWLRTLAGERVTRRGAWHIHIGSGEWLAEVRPIGGGTVAGEGYARITLSAPAPLAAGDRFVLREAGRRATVAGGIIVDAVPATAPQSSAESRMEALIRRRAAVAAGRGADLLALHVRDRGADSLSGAAAAVGLPADQATDAAREARLLKLGLAVADPGAVGRWSAAVADALAAYHAANPVDRFAPRTLAVQSAVAAGCPGDLAGDLLGVLARLGRIVADGPGVRHPDHAVRLDPAQQRARDALVAALERKLFAPPNLSDAAAQSGASAALIRELEAEGTLVRLTADLAVTRRAVDEAAAVLRAAFAAEGPLTAARAKELLSTTRKYALPLLELLDQRGITRRRGDVRDVL